MTFQGNKEKGGKVHNTSLSILTLNSIFVSKSDVHFIKIKIIFL